MKIALLGTSHWHAKMHYEAALAAGAEIVASWDASEAHSAEFAARTGIPNAATPEAALAGADLAVLMGHPRGIPDLARRLIAMGMPMILEKPAAAGTVELEALLAEAAHNNAFVAVPLPNRHGPAMTELRRLMAEGPTGHVRHAGFRLINGPPKRYRLDGVEWLLDPHIAGGGALRNLGIHGVDAAISLARGPLRVASSHIGKRIHTNEAVEDHAVVVLCDESGALFVIETGYTYASIEAGGDFEWRIATTNTTLIDRGDTAFAACLDDGQRYELLPEPTSLRYRGFMIDTLERLASGRPPAVALADYVKAMRLIDVAYEKAKQ